MIKKLLDIQSAIVLFNIKKFIRVLDKNTREIKNLVLEFFA